MKLLKSDIMKMIAVAPSLVVREFSNIVFTYIISTQIYRKIIGNMAYKVEIPVKKLFCPICTILLCVNDFDVFICEFTRMS